MWVSAARKAMDGRRKAIFAKLKGKNLGIGSDCTGADASFSAARMWAPMGECTVSNEMASEAPNAEGPMLFQLLNHNPKILFKDQLARGFSGFDIVSNATVPIPMDLHIYSAGTVCVDFSSYNTLNPKKLLDLAWIIHTNSVNRPIPATVIKHIQQHPISSNIPPLQGVREVARGVGCPC